MKTTVVHVAIILFVAATIFFTNLGDSQLWDRDEPRNAGCAVEMMERGDLVVPIFNGELRHQKPVLLYWLIISAYEVFGVNEFAARFWSAVLGIGSVLATYVIANRLLGSTVALLAAMVLATSLMFNVAARAATPDSVLIFCNTIALMIYVLATFAPFDSGPRLRHENTWFPKRWLAIVMMYGAMGIGVLAKGPIGFVIPCAVIGLFMLIGRLTPSPVVAGDNLANRLLKPIKYTARLFHPLHFANTLWTMRPLTLAAVVLLIAAPWFWMVNVRTEGDFTRMFFWEEHFGRATTAFENHRGGLWFYPLAILIGFLPWAVFWGPVSVGLARRSRVGLDAASIFCLCWIGVQVGVFSIAQTKLPSYVTPCYGGLAILTADCLYRWSKSRESVSDFWIYGAEAGLVLAGLLIATGLGLASFYFLDGAYWLAAIGLLPIIAGLIGCWQIRQGYRESMVLTNVFVATLFTVAFFGFGAQAVSQQQTSRDFLADVAAADDNVKVATFGCLESSWVFYGQKTLYELSGGNSTAMKMPSAAGLDRPHDWRPKKRLTPEQFVAACPSAMFVTTNEKIDELKNRLPQDYEVVRTTKYFLRDKTLYLLARKPARFAEKPNN